MEAPTSATIPWPDVLGQIHQALEEALASVEHQEQLLATFDLQSQADSDQANLWHHMLVRLAEQFRDWQQRARQLDEQSTRIEHWIHEQEATLVKWQGDLSKVHDGMGGVMQG